MTALYLLDKTEKVIKIIPQSELIENWQSGGINELDTLEGVIKLTPELKEMIDQVYYYAVQDIDDKFSFHLYKAISNKIDNSNIAFYGLQVGFDELKGKGYVKDFRPSNRTVSFVMNTILADTGWELGFVDDRLPLITNTFYYINRLEALSKVIELTGCEIDFKVAITGNEITMKYIDIHYQIGEDTGKRFVYGTNALEIVKEFDTAELYTAMVGRGKGVEIGDGYGRKLSFAGIEWKKSAGNPVDKPLGQEFIEIPEATALYGYSDGKPRTFIKEYNDIEDVNELINATYNDLKLMIRPKVQFKAAVSEVGDLKIGDTVTIVRYDLGIKYQTRVFNVKRNRINNTFTKVELGDVIVQSNAKKTADFTKNINGKIETIKENLANVEIVAADGTKVTYGPDQPVTAKVNDLWYEELVNGETNLRKWNGELWEIIVFDAFGEEVKNSVNEAIAEIEVTKGIANSAVSKADLAIEEAGFAQVDSAKAISDALAATNEAAIAKTNAATAVTNAETAITTANGAKTTSEAAVLQAGESISNSNIAIENAQIALNAYNDLKIGGRNLIANSRYIVLFPNESGWGNSVLKMDEATPYYRITGDSFISTYEWSIYSWMNENCIVGNSYTIGVDVRIPEVGSVGFDTNMGMTEITQANVWTRIFHTFDYVLNYFPSGLVYDKAQLDYRDWKLEEGNIGTAWSPNPNDVQVQITNINGELSQKVSQTNFDTLNGTVTTQGTLISQSQTAINLKADRTVTDTLNNTVADHATKIKINSDGLVLKAEKSLVDTINGTVSTHTTQIKATSDGLALKADDSKVNTLSGTVTTQGTSISANASAIALRATTSTVNALSSTVTTQGTSITANANAIALKAEKSLVDSINGTVTSQGTSISANASAIALKANTTTVNTLSGTVTSQGTSISANATAIALKAEKSIVDTLSGKVTTNTTNISANATAITARLTSAQVDSLVTGKNYVNQTTLNATSSSLSSQITQVETSKVGIIENMVGPGKIFNNPVSDSRSSVTGALIINTPITPNGYMTKLTISGYNYTNTNTNIELEISFYAYSTTAFVNYSYVNKGNFPVDSVRIALDSSGKVVVIIGGGGSSWSYPKIQVKEALIGHSNPPDSFKDGWSIEYLTTFPPYTILTNVLGVDYNVKISTIEQTVDGIQTTVGTKASQTQVTQLAGQITSKVESSTYTSKMTQLDSAINLRVQSGDVTAAILADKTIKDTRNDNQLPDWYNANYPKQIVFEFKNRSIMGVSGSATYGQLETKVIWSHTAGGVITQIFSSSDGVFQRTSNASYSAWLSWDKVAESGKLISQINISTEGILLQGKRIQLDGEVTMTTAFVGMIKAIDLVADRITTGTLNGTNVNIINLNVSKLVGDKTTFIQSAWNAVSSSVSIDGSGILTSSGTLATRVNAGSITNSSGTKSGLINALGMEISDSSNGYNTKLYSDGLEFKWYDVIRRITQNSEGLEIKPVTGSGYRLNSALYLTTGPGADKISYLQLSNPDGGANARLEMNGTQLSLRHPNGGSLDIADYQYNGQLGRINSGKFRTTTTDGRGIEMASSQISVLAGNQTIYIMPSGTGELRIGNGSFNPTLWPIRASQFIQGSSRDSKTNIKKYNGKAVELLESLEVVTYNRKDDLERGSDYESIGFIAEDSPCIAVENKGNPAGVDNYKMVSLAIKGIQELSEEVKWLKKMILKKGDNKK